MLQLSRTTLSEATAALWAKIWQLLAAKIRFRFNIGAGGADPAQITFTVADIQLQWVRIGGRSTIKNFVDFGCEIGFCIAHSIGPRNTVNYILRGIYGVAPKSEPVIPDVLGEYFRV